MLVLGGFLATIFLCRAPLARAINASAAAAFDTAFQSPPIQFRPKFRYWLPDASVPADVVRQDVASVADVGGGGLEFLPFYLYGVPDGSAPPTDWTKFGFGSPAYKDLLKVALEETKARGLVLDIAQGANQGQGVPSPPQTPGLAVELAYGTADVNGGEIFTGPLPGPSPAAFLPGFMHAPEQFGQPTLKAVLAGAVDEVSVVEVSGGPMNQIVLNEASIVDITSQTGNGALNWTAPNGNAAWKVIAFYEKYTNQRSCTAGVGAADTIGNGSWIVDHFSVDGAKRITDFWDNTILDTQEIKELIASVGEYFWEDSMEMQSALFWTPSLPERFEQNRGYSVIQFLPLLFDISNQWGSSLAAYNESFVYGTQGSGLKAAVLADYRTTLTEAYQDYLGHFVSWSHALGVRYSSQPGYNLPLDMGQSAAIPVLDAPETESLGFPTEDALLQFTGSALLTGKRIVSTEVGAISGAPFTQTVPDLLRLFKESFAAGVSMMVVHGFAYTGEYPLTNWPGYNAFVFSFTEMWNNKVPSWEQLKDAFDFTARNSLVLQSGTPQVDIAFYYYAAPWELRTRFQSPVLSDLGFTYNYLGPENLSPSLEVKDRVLMPAGPSYRALIISNETSISGSTVDAIETYTASGLPVLLLGELPNVCLGVNACPSSKPFSRLQTLPARFSNARAVATAAELPAALSSAGVTPRVSFQAAPNSWYTAWRRADDESEDRVYVYNAGQTAATIETRFSVDVSAMPYMLDAWTGERVPVLQYERSDAGITIPVTLQSNQSRIFTFSVPSTGATSTAYVTSANGKLNGLYTGQNSTLEARLVGPAVLVLSDGRVVTSNASRICPINIDSWNLTLRSYVPASNDSTATAFETIQRSIKSLMPWSTISGAESVSGVGEYNSTFSFPYNPAITGASISFGPVKDTLRAWVNGHQVLPIDVTDPSADITALVRQGFNSIRVVVTSSLFNAVKARAYSTKMLNKTAAESNSVYLSARLAEFGLLGPVLLQPLQRVPLA